MPFRFDFNFILAIILFGFFAPLQAQALLEIRVQGPERQALRDKTIYLRDSLRAQTFEAQTDDQGFARFFDLYEGQDFFIEWLGDQDFQPLRLGPLRLSELQAKGLSLKLQALEPSQNLPSLVYQVNLLTTQNAQIGSELHRAELEALPIEGRDLRRALHRLPHLTQATGFFPEAPLIAINGANALFVNYQIDGLDNNENFLGGQRFDMPLGFAAGIEVLNNHFGAAQGWTANGLINLRSRRADNRTEVEAYYQWRPGRLTDAPSRFAQRDLYGNLVKDGFMRHQTGVVVGLPLQKDKTFLLFNYEYSLDQKDQLLNVPSLNLNQTIRGYNRQHLLSARLDQHWTTKLRSALRFNYGGIEVERPGGAIGGGNTLPSAASTQTRQGLNLALKNSYQRGQGLAELNFLYGRFAWDYARPQAENSPAVLALEPSGLVAFSLGHPGFVFENLEQTLVVQPKYQLQWAKHHLRLGGEWRYSDFALRGGGPEAGAYTVQLNQAQLQALRALGLGANLQPQDLPSDVEVLFFERELRPNAQRGQQQLFSIYFEDQWRLNSGWQLSAGLRYDFDALSRAGGQAGDWNNLGPRLALTYQPKEGQSVWRWGYAKAYDKIPYVVYSDALQFGHGGEDFRRQLAQLQSLGLLPQNAQLDNLLSEGNLRASAPAAYLQGPQAAELRAQGQGIFSNEWRILPAQAWQNPYAHQFMMGYQRAFESYGLFSADLIHNRSYHLFRLRDLNAPPPFESSDAQPIRTQAEADALRPVPIFSDGSGFYTLDGLDTLRSVARNVIVSESEGRSNYYALSLTWQKPRNLGANYDFRLSYTLAYLENNTEDINFRAADANNFEAEWGPSINDRRHVLNFWGSWRPWRGLELTAAALWQSGQPVNRIPDAAIFGTTDLNGDGRSFSEAYLGNNDRQPNEGRNSDRLPGAFVVDLGLAYVWSLPRAQRLSLRADVFNVFNALVLSGYAHHATQSNQIQVGPAASGLYQWRNAGPPRQFQFGLFYHFSKD